MLEIGEDDFLKITHLIDLFIVDGDLAIDEPINDNFNVELIFNHIFIRMLIIDIFLDVAFFNSYSFLKDMTHDEKKNFSIKKFNFFISEGLTSCFSEINDNLGYYSFAFSCHKNVEYGKIKSQACSEFDLDLDLDKYIGIWDKFIKENYPNEYHHEKSIKEQIKLHVDNNQIPPNFFKKFDTLSPGIYYIIRLNKMNDNLYLKKELSSIFQGTKLNIGLLKIIKLNEFNNYYELFQNKIISCFKIVKVSDQ